MAIPRSAKKWKHETDVVKHNHIIR